MPKKISKKIFLFLLFSIFLFSFVFAQERKLEIEYPKIGGIKPETLTTGLELYVKYIFNLAVIIVGIILFSAILWGGFVYLTAAGDPVKLKEARERIVNGFLGVLLLLSGYIVLTVVNPELIIFKIPFLQKLEKKAPEYKPTEYKPETITHIFYEIPIGQMLENGLFEKTKINKLKAITKTHREFLTQKIKTSSETFEKISDLNKYLKALADDCHCEELTGICLKPKNFAMPAGCSGDPCKKVREKINEVLKINKDEMEKLSAFKKEFTEIKNILEDEGRKFRNLTNVFELCKERELLTRPEYYDALAFLEAHGGKTKLIKSYLPALADDPLVFYCSVGGTIYDIPYESFEISAEETEMAKELSSEVLTNVEPLSCPVEIPIGEIIIDQITQISYEINSNLEEVIFYLDKVSAELTKMTELISQCNESRCHITCCCIPNPCYKRCTNILCKPFCKSPCLQAIGGCHGEPCPRQELIETTERIKIYEEEILNRLDWIEGDIEDAQLILEAKEKDQIDLKTLRGVVQTCLDLSDSDWVLLPCYLALGQKGPDGNPIKECHPQNFFCCSQKPPAEIPFPSVIEKRRPEITIPPPTKPYSPSEKTCTSMSCQGETGKSASCKVPFFCQCDPRWKNFVWYPPYHLCRNGCMLTAAAMVLRYFGIETDPIKISEWALEKGYLSKEGLSRSFWEKGIQELGKGQIKTKIYHGNIQGVLDELSNDKNKIAVTSAQASPPYSSKGHFIVLTGIEKKWDQEFIRYNDPGTCLCLRRPCCGELPIDFFQRKNIEVGVVFYK